MAVEQDDLYNCEAERPADVRIDTTMGSIEIKLEFERAPLSARHFLANVERGIYTDSEFYRAVLGEKDVKVGFVQGGIEGELARGAPLQMSKEREQTVAHESNDETGLRNVAGSIAYPRFAPGSASSEFFINICDNPIFDAGPNSTSGDGLGYAVFGTVVCGMDVLHAIQRRALSVPVSQDGVYRAILDEPVKILRAVAV